MTTSTTSLTLDDVLRACEGRQHWHDYTLIRGKEASDFDRRWSSVKSYWQLIIHCSDFNATFAIAPLSRCSGTQREVHDFILDTVRVIDRTREENELYLCDNSNRFRADPALERVFNLVMPLLLANEAWILSETNWH